MNATELHTYTKPLRNYTVKCVLYFNVSQIVCIMGRHVGFVRKNRTV